MRILGTILMILGANLVVGSIAFAFWATSFGCAMGSTSGKCRQNALKLFFDVMASTDGIIFWIVIAAGLLVFWWGKRTRAAA